MKNKKYRIILCMLCAIAGFISFYDANSKEKVEDNYELTLDNSTTDLNLKGVKDGIANVSIKRNDYLVSKGDIVKIDEKKYSGDVNYIKGHFKVKEVKEDSVVLSMKLKYEPDVIAGVFMCSAMGFLLFIALEIITDIIRPKSKK